MTRNLKLLGLSLVAVLALGAVAATVASAKFDSEVEHTTGSAEQPIGKPHEYTVEAGTTTCKTAKFTTTTVGKLISGSNPPTYTSEDIRIAAAYTGCTTLLLGEAREAHVKMNGCELTFTAGATVEGNTKVAGTNDLVCPAGAAIDVEITGANICTITVPAQNNVAGITFHNTGSGAARDVDLFASSTSVQYIQHGVFCPGNAFQSTKEFANGKYVGELTIKGFNTAGTQVGIWVT